MHKLINSFTLAIDDGTCASKTNFGHGPKIILRGAIPIDSNIGGYGHHPLFGEVVSRGCFVLSFAFLPLCVARSCGVVLPRSFCAKACLKLATF